ncbi:hypothetical protein F5Y14DRAFT_243283 [Nemania sp. NC0429]|nr:hypothetical protein F5Y14DRAFT_243283 [Nemania sp. NC0429]
MPLATYTAIAWKCLPACMDSACHCPLTSRASPSKQITCNSASCHAMPCHDMSLSSATSMDTLMDVFGRRDSQVIPGYSYCKPTATIPFADNNRSCPRTRATPRDHPNYASYLRSPPCARVVAAPLPETCPWPASLMERESCTAWDSTLRFPKPASGLPVRSRMPKSLSLQMVRCNGGCGKCTSLATDAVDDAIPTPLQMATYLSLSRRVRGQNIDNYLEGILSYDRRHSTDHFYHISP